MPTIAPTGLKHNTLSCAAVHWGYKPIDQGEVVTMRITGQHVIPSGQQWSIRRAGAARARPVLAGRDDAIALADQIARRERGTLYIHGSDGRIEERRSYLPRNIA